MTKRRNLFEELKDGVDALAKQREGITPFDASNYLDSAEVIAVYLREALNSGDDQLLQAALSDVAKVTPKAISTAAEYGQAVMVLNALLDAGGADENHPLAARADAVGSLIAEYEARNKHIGSSFDDFLKQEGRLDEATEAARKRLEQIKRK
ncbi:hypothetical protein [Paraburkholderia caledonica]|uniref:DNA-binding phage protein n=1 Tax=Paraburkholderia caledonica TaxID=134536 RepID=A0AB73IQN5_9BURK|nr:DNA-binding phage protein [Paraburkholderia caledonica]